MLESQLTQVFSKFGVVYVKIRRDTRNMPFAFCQYTVSDTRWKLISSVTNVKDRTARRRTQPWLKARELLSPAELAVPRW